MPEAMTPAGWKGLQAVMTPEIQQNEELRREQATRRMDLDERQKALANIKRLYPGLPPQQMAQFELWASSRSAPVPAMTGAMMTPTVSRVQAESMSADQRALHGIPPDANGPYWIYVNKLTGEPSRQAQPAATTSAMVAGENGLEFVPRIPGKIAPAGGGAALPPSALTPRNTGVNSTGQNVYNDVFGIRSGSPLGQSPGLLPQISSSTISSPGSAPVTTQTERRRGGISGPTPPAAGAPKSTSSAAPAITPISGSTGNAIAERAKKVASGDLPLPAGRDGAAVQQYMAEHAMELPTPMSPKGQENIARVDSVLMEIQDLNSALAAIKGNPSLAVDYARYKYLGQSTPYDALFTKISFEGLRSAAAALQGNGSRAYPVIKRAFEHIPNLDRLGGLNPDSVSLMKDKLKAMQKVLEDTRKTVMSDEKKSGVIGGLEPAVGTVEDGYRYKGGGASTPSNWEPVGAGR
jgi:hypothetical protein